jgi:uncharacterized membrane protein
MVRAADFSYEWPPNRHEAQSHRRDRMPESRSALSRASSPDLAQVVERNIRALVEHRREQDGRRSGQERIADAITRFTGSMRFVYIHLVVFGLWILINLGWIPGVPQFDPTFVVLAMIASVEAIFLSTFVLISQNRMALLADRRADLDLQISLLAEHEITRVITLVTAIADRLDLAVAQNPELAELAQDVAPEKVMEKMEAHERGPSHQGSR